MIHTSMINLTNSRTSRQTVNFISVFKNFYIEFIIFLKLLIYMICYLLKFTKYFTYNLYSAITVLIYVNLILTSFIETIIFISSNFCINKVMKYFVIFNKNI